MIIVRLMGGLGNQLFQYAFGRALSEKTGQKLFFDDSFFLVGQKEMIASVRQYELDKFSLEVNCSTPFLVRNVIDLKYRYTKNKFLRVLRKLLKVRNSRSIRFIDERFFAAYDEQILPNCRTGINYYNGCWQTYQYFKNIRSILLEELKIKKTLLSPLSLALSESIQKENAVSIHIRRGDYLQPEWEILGVCSLDYYKQAIELLIKEEKNPSFYIFSNDMEWTKANLKIVDKPVYYIEHTFEETGYEDLYLMSICKHQIIANSTFSWWAAWLNNYPLKRVIAPEKWFAKKWFAHDLDLIPPDWIRI